ncbi:MAG: helix-turn-helix domain-containing protein [Beijerinckiaceae bacterium]
MASLIRTPKALGAVIQSERKQRGLSQGRLAEQVGLTQSAVSIIEKGHSGLKIETLLSVLAALGLDLQVTPRLRGSIEDFKDLL